MTVQIAITGASGFIAREFQKYYAAKYEFIRISQKSNPDNNTYSWDDIIQAPQILAKVSCVINLAGANIGEKRWTPARKELILNSRLQTTANLIQVLNQLEVKPDLLCASAVGIYPTSGIYDEYSELDYAKEANFCETITKRWEKVTHTYQGRVVNMRFGVVLSGYGGALSKILLPFKLGMGTGISDGNWSFSWISIIDLCRAIDYLIEQREIAGAINLLSPQHISYHKLIQTIVLVYKKHCWFNLPKWLIKLMFGQMGEELLLSGQHVLPQKLLHQKFNFKYPNIESCLKAIHAREI